MCCLVDGAARSNLSRSTAAQRQLEPIPAILVVSAAQDSAARYAPYASRVLATVASSASPALRPRSHGLLLESSLLSC